MISRRRREVISRFMVWWCRFFLVWGVLALLANVVDRHVWSASLNMVGVVVMLFFLDWFRQQRDAHS